MSDSEKFEHRVRRVHELLERSGAQVTWNDHLDDPDDPGQPRQIDVTIRRANHLTLVECRIHHRAQNVQWIEELIGRRLSLRADAVVAVSSSGFTKGAIRKAGRQGVILRDFRALTEDEVGNWGRSVTLTLLYYQYSDATLSLLFRQRSLARLDLKELKTQLKSHPILQAVFIQAAEQFGPLKLATDEHINDKVKFDLRLKPEDLKLAGEPLVEVEFTGQASVMSREVICPVVAGYGSPEIGSQRDAIVERFPLGETSVIHDEPRVTVVIDISMAEVPSLCQFRFARISANEETEFETFELVGADKLTVSPGRLNIRVGSCASA